MKALQTYLPLLLTLAIAGSQNLLPFAYAEGLASSSAAKPLPTVDTAAVLSLATTDSSAASARLPLPMKVNQLEKHDYRSDEDVTIMVNNPEDQDLKVAVTDVDGKKAAIPVQEKDLGIVTEVALTPPNNFKPGKYTVTITDETGKATEQDFTWGVLAINTNKSIYAPNERAAIAIAVLNELGTMVCNADVALQITNEARSIDDTLSTANDRIKINPECTTHDFTLKPDYEASYQIGGEGTYAMTLTAKTKNGTFTIKDAFEVKAAVPFTVERTTATRIYPPHTYPVTFTITANQDFSGKIVETIPSSFRTTILSSSGSAVLGEQIVNESVSERQQASSSAQEVSSAQNPEPSIDTPIAEGSQNVSKDIVPPLHMPFYGNFAQTQPFGGLPDDPLLALKYKQFGVIGHDGIDFALPMNTPVASVDNGMVLSDGQGDYGTTIVIQHVWGRTYYGHLQDVTVTKGQLVSKGEQIGLSGNTGLSTGPHLHFGLLPNRFDNSNGYLGKVDPLIYLSQDSASQAPDVLGASTTTSETRTLAADITLKKGETATFSYAYKAPNISPQFYTLGPLTFTDIHDDTVFKEARQWQIASDATWYSGNWDYRKTITIDNAQVTGNQTNFPVLINVGSDADLASGARTNGFDILFTSSDATTKIPHEIESYNSGTGALVAWVQVPSLSTASDTVIYMYYGNPASCEQDNASCDASVNATDVWDGNYRSVHHMNQTSSPQLNSTSTSSLDYATGTGTPVHGTATAKIGGATGFDSASGETVSNATNLTATSYTLEAWIRPTSLSCSSSCLIWSNSLSASPWYTMLLNITAGNNFNMQWRNSGGTLYQVTGDDTLSTNTYYHVVTTSNGSTMNMYVNGSLAQFGAGSPTGTGMAGTAGTVIGGGGTQVFQGQVDEVRFSTTARSATYISTSYNNQNSPNTFYTIGSETCMTDAPLDMLLRHGKWFNACGEQAFTF